MHACWQNKEGDRKDGNCGDGANRRVTSYVAHSNQDGGGDCCTSDCDAWDANEWEWVNVGGPPSCINDRAPADFDECPGVPSVDRKVWITACRLCNLGENVRQREPER